MRKVIRYKLNGGGKIPDFVYDGGYFGLNHDYVGISIDTNKEYLPATVKVLTKQELFDRILVTEKNSETNEALTEVEADEVLEWWLNRKNITLE